MQYTCEIIIDRPRDRVVAVFDDPDAISKWQPTFVRMEPVSGEPGTPGAQTRLIHHENGREMVMLETIETRNLPDEMSLVFEMRGLMGVWNRVHNRFEAVAADKTRWVMESEFKFRGLMALMAPFMRGAFPKQTQQSMQLFKDYVESQT